MVSNVWRTQAALGKDAWVRWNWTDMYASVFDAPLLAGSLSRRQNKALGTETERGPNIAPGVSMRLEVTYNIENPGTPIRWMERKEDFLSRNRIEGIAAATNRTFSEVFAGQDRMFIANTAKYARYPETYALVSLVADRGYKPFCGLSLAGLHFGSIMLDSWVGASARLMSMTDRWVDNSVAMSMQVPLEQRRLGFALLREPNVRNEIRKSLWVSS